MAMVDSVARASAVAPGMATEFVVALAVAMVVSVASAMAVAPGMARECLMALAMALVVAVTSAKAVVPGMAMDSILVMEPSVPFPVEDFVPLPFVEKPWPDVMIPFLGPGPVT